MGLQPLARSPLDAGLHRKAINLMTASQNALPRSVAEFRLLYFGTGRWRHDFLDGRATGSGRDSLLPAVGSLAIHRDRQVQRDAIRSTRACPRPVADRYDLQSRPGCIAEAGPSGDEPFRPARSAHNSERLALGFAARFSPARRCTPRHRCRWHAPRAAWAGPAWSSHRRRP